MTFASYALINADFSLILAAYICDISSNVHCDP